MTTTDSTLSSCTVATSDCCPASPLTEVVNPTSRSPRSYSASVVVKTRRGTTGTGTSASNREVTRMPFARVSVETDRKPTCASPA